MMERSPGEAATSRSFIIPTICSSEKRLRFTLWSSVCATANVKPDYAPEAYHASRNPFNTGKSSAI